MRQTICSKQEEVSNAIRSQQWPDLIAAHVAECEICRDVTSAARWMQSLADSSDADSVAPVTRALPDPGLVWWKAQLSERHSRPEKGRLFMETMQICSMVITPIALAGWVAWNWYDIQAVAERFLLDMWPQISIATYAVASLAPAIPGVGSTGHWISLFHQGMMVFQRHTPNYLPAACAEAGSTLSEVRYAAMSNMSSFVKFLMTGFIITLLHTPVR